MTKSRKRKQQLMAKQHLLQDELRELEAYVQQLQSDLKNVKDELMKEDADNDS